MVEAIWGQEPPWREEGDLLDETQAKKAMDKELDNLASYKVYQEVPESEAEGHKIISTR